MFFILSNEFITNLRSLSKEYKKRSGVDLQNPHQPNSINCFFGAKDVKTRRKQVSLIEQWLQVLQNDLLSDEVPVVSTQKNFRAQSILVAVCLYLKFQIEQTYKIRSANNAVLLQLLNEALGINSKNQMDDQTKAYCFTTVAHYLSKEGRFETINARLTSPFSKNEWRNFFNFVTTQNELLKSKSEYPITEFILPVFAVPTKFIGETAGYVIGDMIGKSLQSLQSKYLLLGTMGGGVMVAFHAVSAQTVFFMLTPVYASRLLNALCGVSFSWALGQAGHLVGKGIGMGLGLPLDLGWKFVSKYSNIIHDSNKVPELDGISLTRKSRFIQGNEFSLAHVDSLVNNIQSIEKEIQSQPQSTPWQIQFAP